MYGRIGMYITRYSDYTRVSTRHQGDAENSWKHAIGHARRCTKLDCLLPYCHDIKRYIAHGEDECARCCRAREEMATCSGCKGVPPAVVLREMRRVLRLYSELFIGNEVKYSDIVHGELRRLKQTIEVRGCGWGGGRA